MSLNDPQWGKRGSGGPPDLDEIWRNVNRKINELFGRKTEGPTEQETDAGLEQIRAFLDASQEVHFHDALTDPLPKIATQPANQTVTQGQTATFTVTASAGSVPSARPPRTAQWKLVL
jgi:hypothetical protein